MGGPLENCALLLRPTRVRLYAQQATTNAAQCQAVPVCLDLCSLLFMYANRMALQIRNAFLILQNIEAVKGPFYELWEKIVTSKSILERYSNYNSIIYI